MTWAIEDGEGKLLTEVDDVTERWRSYCETLYANSSASTPYATAIDEHCLEPDILESEIRDAIRKLKTNNSADIDKIFAEELKHLGDQGVKIMLGLCNQLWKTGK